MYLEFWIGYTYRCYAHTRITVSFCDFVFYLLFLAVVVVSVCKRLKDLVTLLEAPIRGVAPMFTALRKLQVSAEHLTPLHAEFLMLCLLAKCYKTGLSILDDDVFEVDHPRDLYLYCYYGCVAFFFSFELEKRDRCRICSYISVLHFSYITYCNFFNILDLFFTSFSIKCR